MVGGSGVAGWSLFFPTLANGGVLAKVEGDSATLGSQVWCVHQQFSITCRLSVMQTLTPQSEATESGPPFFGKLSKRSTSVYDYCISV